MKKSTLISTLAMVVIVALALTTATFAWYQANNKVTAKTQAVAAVAGSADLAVGTTTGNLASAIELGTGDEGAKQITGLKPLSVKSENALAVGTEYADTTAVDGILHGQYTQLVGTTEEFKTGSAYPDGFFATPLLVKNKSGDTTRQVAVTLKVKLSNDTSGTGDNAKLTKGLRIAVFKQNADSKFELLGILGNSEYSFTDNFTDATPGSLSTDDATAMATGLSIGNIVGNDTATLRLVIWLDGEIVNATEAEKTIDIEIEIEGGTPTLVSND